jgi:hypothetical protein
VTPPTASTSQASSLPNYRRVTDQVIETWAIEFEAGRMKGQDIPALERDRVQVRIFRRYLEARGQV